MFPNEFTPVHPWGDNPDLYFEDEDDSQKQVVIKQLMHVTHDADAQKIASVDKMLKFRTAPKFGKVLGAYDGSPCGESFKSNPDHTLFDFITPNETVFPGLYSWWSIYPEKGETRNSRYGNNAFVCEFPHLLTAYAKSRQTDVHNVCLRKGGTLRYRQEICYVLIICKEGDGDRELSEFGPLEILSNTFDTNGLTDENGRIDEISAIPTFHPELFMGSRETAAIAFYFPEIVLSVPVEKSSECCQQIAHDYCIKKRPPPSGGQPVCLNELNY